MTDIATVHALPGADLAVRADPVSDLIAWAESAQQAWGIAQRLADTSFVPKTMMRRPDEITAAILTGQELGLSPMSALRSIDVIDGTPAMRAHALRGLVQHHGHTVWVEESNDSRAIVCGQRAGSGHVERSTWTIDRAKKANLAGKKNWQTHPAAMLVARATAEVCRLIAADVLLGMPYAVEELSDGAHPVEAGPAVETTRKPTTTRTARRAPVVDPATVEPPLPVQAAEEREEERQQAHAEATPEPTPEPEGGDDMITPAQSRRMHAQFNEAGVKDRLHRLAMASTIIGRTIASSSELTRAEASKIIDAFVHGLPDDDPDEPMSVADDTREPRDLP